jgi:hypothetical protein
MCLTLHRMVIGLLIKLVENGNGHPSQAVLRYLGVYCVICKAVCTKHVTRIG